MNEKINIENYEAFLLDLMEGNLSDAQHADLMSFLADHPEIDWEMDELPQLELAETEIDGQFKKSLLKDEETGLSRSEHLMISSIEGIINQDEQEELSSLLANDDRLKKEQAYYDATILEKEIVLFPQKDQLIKEETRVIPIWTSVASIAAAILVLVFFNLPSDQAYNPRDNGFVLLEVNTSEESPTIISASPQVEEDPQIGREAKEQQRRIEQEDPIIKSSEQIAQVDSRFEESPQEADPKVPSSKEIPNTETPREQEELPIEQNSPSIIATEQIAQVENQTEENNSSSSSSSSPSSSPSSSSPSSSSTEEKPISPLGYARKLIKEDVLKDRTLTETVTNITKDKIKIERGNKEKDRPAFALKIGKLKITKK